MKGDSGGAGTPATRGGDNVGAPDGAAALGQGGVGDRGGRGRMRGKEGRRQGEKRGR